MSAARHDWQSRLPGRRCAICRRIGGAGSTTILRLLGIEIPRGEIGYAHSSCVANERRKQELAKKETTK